MSLDASGSRVSIMLRLVGAAFLVLGASLTYFTYVGEAQASVAPQIVPVFYLGAGLLMLVGLVALVANYSN
jgi:hypothetical protein